MKSAYFTRRIKALNQDDLKLIIDTTYNLILRNFQDFTSNKVLFFPILLEKIRIRPADFPDSSPSSAPNPLSSSIAHNRSTPTARSHALTRAFARAQTRACRACRGLRRACRGLRRARRLPPLPRLQRGCLDRRRVRRPAGW